MRIKASSIVLLVLFIGLAFIAGLYAAPLLKPPLEVVSVIPATPAQEPEEIVQEVTSDDLDLGDFDAGREAMIEEVNMWLMNEGILEYPLDTDLGLSDRIDSVYGFIKEVGSDHFILEFLTSQYNDPSVAIFGERLEKKVEINLDTSVKKLVNQKLAEQVVAEEGVAEEYDPNLPSFSQSGPGLPEDGGPINTFMTISFDELKTGDYVQVVSKNGVLKEGSVAADSITLHELEGNPYLKGEFNSYDGLPLTLFDPPLLEY